MQDDMVLWQEFVNKFSALDVQYSVPGNVVAQKVCVFAFERAHGGSRLWWVLPELFGNMGLPGQPAVWYQKHWQAWTKFLDRNFGLHPPHLRKAKGTLQSKPEDEPGEDCCGLPAGRERVLPKASWSTAALVLLAAKFATNMLGKARDAVSTAWSAFLRGLVSSWVCAREQQRFTLYMDIVFMRLPGQTAVGRHPLDIIVDIDGTVSLQQAPMDSRGTTEHPLLLEGPFECGGADGGGTGGGRD